MSRAAVVDASRPWRIARDRLEAGVPRQLKALDDRPALGDLVGTELAPPLVDLVPRRAPQASLTRVARTVGLAHERRAPVGPPQADGAMQRREARHRIAAHPLVL